MPLITTVVKLSLPISSPMTDFRKSSSLTMCDVSPGCDNQNSITCVYITTNKTVSPPFTLGRKLCTKMLVHHDLFSLFNGRFFGSNHGFYLYHDHGTSVESYLHVKYSDENTAKACYIMCNGSDLNPREWLHPAFAPVAILLHFNIHNATSRRTYLSQSGNSTCRYSMNRNRLTLHAAQWFNSSVSPG